MKEKSPSTILLEEYERVCKLAETDDTITPFFERLSGHSPISINLITRQTEKYHSRYSSVKIDRFPPAKEKNINAEPLKPLKPG